ncbi:MAG: hypothetical protein WD510_02495, partial [Balneolaceae bacterium]
LTLKETEKKDILFGFWDSDHTPEDAPQNVKKLYWNNLGSGRVIPMIGGFTADMPESDIRKRLRNRRAPVDRADQVEYILLLDEPFYKNFTTEQQDLILKCAKQEIPGYKFAFSYARGALRDQGKCRLPKNLDVAMINNYTFYHEEYWPEMYITMQDQFELDLLETVNIIRCQGISEIVITGQSIMDEKKYRKPPLESVQWNVDFCYKYNLSGVIWFEYRDRSHWKGAESMSDFYQQQKAVFEGL